MALTALRKEQIGYAKLGCALALARLENSVLPLTTVKEKVFVADCMEWLETYFSCSIPVKGEAN